MLNTLKDLLSQKKSTDLEFSYRGHQVWERLENKNLTADEMSRIQQIYGYDVASWILFKFFKEKENYSQFMSYVDGQRGTIYSKDNSEYVVFVMTHNPWVPRQANEDYQWELKNLATDAGFECSFPEIPYRRSIFPNAYYYQDVLKRFSGRKVIFLTHSLASLEVRWLLERSQQLNIRVAGWLNLSGLIYGTSLPPSSEDLFYSIKRIFNEDHPVLPEVARSNSYCYGDFKFEKNFPMVSLLGFKPSKYFSLSEIFRDKELKFWGPHDGFVSHVDYLKNPGIVWPILGQGHNIDLEVFKQKLQASLKWITLQNITHQAKHPDVSSLTLTD